MSKNAEHQEAYRKRREADSAWRLNTYLSGAAREAVVTTSIQQGITRKDALEQLIQTGASTMKTQFRTDDPATDTGGKRNDSKPALATIRLTAAEVAPRKPVSQPATRKDVSPMTTTNTAPAQPSQMTVAEHQELEKFKESLPNAAIATQQVQQAHAFNGGDDGARRKAAFEAQLNATNQHRK